MTNPFLKFFSNDNDPSNAQKNQSKNKIVIFVGLVVVLGALMFMAGDKKDKNPKAAGNFEIVEENPMAKTNWVGQGVDELTLTGKHLSDVDAKLEALAKDNANLKQIIKEMDKNNKGNFSRLDTELGNQARDFDKKLTSGLADVNQSNDNSNLYTNFPMPNGNGFASDNNQSRQTFGLTKVGEVPRLEEIEEVRYTPMESTLSFINVATPKPKEEKRKKVEGQIIPTGSIIKSVLLSGMDAPTMTQAKSSPLPVLLKVTDLSILPNFFKYDIIDCFLMGEGYGDLTAERAYIRVNNISCITNKRQHIDMALQGAVSGEDGKLGLKGEVVTKQGALLARTLIAGFLQGVGESFANQNQIVTSGWGGTTTTKAEQTAQESIQAGMFQGMSNAAEKLADFYLKMADQIAPVIEISAGREVNVVVTSMTELEVVENTDKFKGGKQSKAADTTTQQQVGEQQ